MEHVKFWIAKDLWEFSVVLSIIAVAVLISFSIWVFDRIKAKANKKQITEPGCMERNIWGRYEKGKNLCKDCGATYESKCVCHAVEKIYFPVEDKK